MIEVIENIRIHDFRFECKLEICPQTKSHVILGINTYFIGIDDFGVRLSDAGSDYVFEGYYQELNDKIDNIVESYNGR